MMLLRIVMGYEEYPPPFYPGVILALILFIVFLLIPFCYFIRRKIRLYQDINDYRDRNYKINIFPIELDESVQYRSPSEIKSPVWRFLAFVAIAILLIVFLFTQFGI